MTTTVIVEIQENGVLARGFFSVKTPVESMSQGELSRMFDKAARDAKSALRKSSGGAD
jgi:hypothetical protein